MVKQLLDQRKRPVATASHRPEPAGWSDDDALTCAWLGHATILMNFLGVKIITDPALRRHVGIHLGPFTLGPKRYIAPALGARELPPLDLVLLTHAHMDHLDTWTLRRIARRNPGARVVTARSTRDLLGRSFFKNARELAWGESCEIESTSGAVRIEAFRVAHWGARMGRDNHRGYNGYLLERGGVRVCIAGDTAFTDFAHVQRPGGIDVMAVPIGAYDPWIANHCTPEQAIRMANQAGARHLLPIHHQTFKLSSEPMLEPIERFTRALCNEPERIGWREVGETFHLKSKK